MIMELRIVEFLSAKKYHKYCISFIISHIGVLLLKYHVYTCLPPLYNVGQTAHKLQKSYNIGWAMRVKKIRQKCSNRAKVFITFQIRLSDKFYFQAIAGPLLLFLENESTRQERTLTTRMHNVSIYVNESDLSVQMLPNISCKCFYIFNQSISHFERSCKCFIFQSIFLPKFLRPFFAYIQAPLLLELMM